MLRRLQSLPPEAGLTAVVLFWGLNFAAIKVPLAVMPPLVVNVLRFALSALVLGVLHAAACRARGVSLFVTFEKAGRWSVVGLGMLSQAVYQVGFILGISRTTAGLAAILIAASPLVTAVAGHALGVDRLRALGWAGFSVSLLGVGVVVLSKPRAASGVASDAVGVALLLGSAVAWGLATVWSRRLLDRGATALGLSFWGVLTAVPVLGALAVPGFLEMSWSRVGVPEWAAIVYSGTLSTGLAYWLWYAAVQKGGPSRAAAFSNLTPFVGVAAGVAFLGEPFVPLQVVGGVLVVAGLVVMRRGDGLKPRAAAAESLNSEEFGV